MKNGIYFAYQSDLQGYRGMCIFLFSQVDGVSSPSYPFLLDPHPHPQHITVRSQLLKKITMQTLGK